MLKTWIALGILGLVLVWGSWQVFILTLPPLKVQIVGGCVCGK